MPILNLPDTIEIPFESLTNEQRKAIHTVMTGRGLINPLADKIQKCRDACNLEIQILENFSLAEPSGGGDCPSCPIGGCPSLTAQQALDMVYLLNLLIFWLDALELHTDKLSGSKVHYIDAFFQRLSTAGSYTSALKSITGLNNEKFSFIFRSLMGPGDNCLDQILNDFWGNCITGPTTCGAAISATSGIVGIAQSCCTAPVADSVISCFLPQLIQCIKDLIEEDDLNYCEAKKIVDKYAASSRLTKDAIADPIIGQIIKSIFATPELKQALLDIKNSEASEELLQKTDLFFPEFTDDTGRIADCEGAPLIVVGPVGVQGEAGKDGCRGPTGHPGAPGIDGTCFTGPVGGTPGACCVNGICLEITGTQCGFYSGDFYGDFTTCASEGGSCYSPTCGNDNECLGGQVCCGGACTDPCENSNCSACPPCNPCSNCNECGGNCCESHQLCCGGDCMPECPGGGCPNCQGGCCPPGYDCCGGDGCCPSARCCVSSIGVECCPAGTICCGEGCCPESKCCGNQCCDTECCGGGCCSEPCCSVGECSPYCPGTETCPSDVEPCGDGCGCLNDVACCNGACCAGDLCCGTANTCCYDSTDIDGVGCCEFSGDDCPCLPSEKCCEEGCVVPCDNGSCPTDDPCNGGCPCPNNTSCCADSNDCCAAADGTAVDCCGGECCATWDSDPTDAPHGYCCNGDGACIPKCIVGLNTGCPCVMNNGDAGECCVEEADITKECCGDGECCERWTDADGPHGTKCCDVGGGVMDCVDVCPGDFENAGECPATYPCDDLPETWPGCGCYIGASCCGEVGCCQDSPDCPDLDGAGGCCDEEECCTCQTLCCPDTTAGDGWSGATPLCQVPCEVPAMGGSWGDAVDSACLDYPAEYQECPDFCDDSSGDPYDPGEPDNIIGDYFASAINTRCCESFGGDCCSDLGGLVCDYADNGGWNPTGGAYEGTKCCPPGTSCCNAPWMDCSDSLEYAECRGGVDHDITGSGVCPDEGNNFTAIACCVDGTGLSPAEECGINGCCKPEDGICINFGCCESCGSPQGCTQYQYVNNNENDGQGNFIHAGLCDEYPDYWHFWGWAWPEGVIDGDGDCVQVGDGYFTQDLEDVCAHQSYDADTCEPFSYGLTDPECIAIASANPPGGFHWYGTCCHNHESGNAPCCTYGACDCKSKCLDYWFFDEGTPASLGSPDWSNCWGDVIEDRAWAVPPEYCCCEGGKPHARGMSGIIMSAS